MGALVIKSWKISDQAFDSKGTRILIQGRDSGLIAWFLALVGIDPTTTWRITCDRLELDHRSWAGSRGIVVPLENITYIFHGYHKPWKPALLLFLLWVGVVPQLLAVFSLFLGLRPDIFRIGAYMTAIPLAALYYILARSFLLGFTVNSGHQFDIRFKRSVIENQEINSKEAAYVCEMLDYLCDNRRQQTPA